MTAECILLFDNAHLFGPTMAVDPRQRITSARRSPMSACAPPGATIEPPPLTREMIRRDVRAAFAELDMGQLEISSRMTPAERFRQLCVVNEFLRHAVIARFTTSVLT